MKFASTVPELNIDSTNGYSVGKLDVTHTLLGYTQKGNGVREYYIKCSECEKDPALFGMGVFIVNLRELRKLRVCGCNCKTARGFPEYHIITLIERKCKEKGYTFLGFVGCGYKGKSYTYLKLRCHCGYYWETTKVTKFLDSDRGCPNCAGNIPWNKEKFLIEAKRVHGDLYDYSLLPDIKNSKQKVTVICRVHGAFTTDTHHHIDRGQGCPDAECVNLKISEANAGTQEDFIAKAENIHGDKYDYSNTLYTRSFNKVTILCKTCLVEFPQLPSDHLAGCGCPYCAGRNQKQSYIFLIGGDATNAFKFGIANAYTSRFSKQRGKTSLPVEVFGVWEYKSTVDCKAAERFIIDNYHGKFLTKRDYPDGYSETLSIKHLDDVIKVYKKFGGRRIK